MNKFITYSALAKLRALVDTSSSCIAMKIIYGPLGNFEISKVSSIPSDDSVTISSNPLVITDMLTLTYLVNGSIDFDYPSEEFILTKESP